MINTIIQGDCLEYLEPIKHSALNYAVITDPPYGGNYNTDYTRFTNGVSLKHNAFKPIEGDTQSFDPSPFFDFEHVTMWGYQHFAAKVPLGTVLVWNKKRDNQLGTFLSDGELAWEKGGYGVYIMRHIWHGFDRQSEKGKTLHPTQKPVSLMEWCIKRHKLPKDTIIFDPYCGSGSTLEAAHNLGYQFIGIELETEYVEVARKRMVRAQAQLRFDVG